MKNMATMLTVMLFSFFIVSFWNKIPIISKTIHFILDPTFGFLLNKNLLFGLILISFILNLILSFVHKYTTDQESLKSLKEEQKKVQEQIKLYKDNPQKVMELQKKQFSSLPKSFELSMGSFVYTAIPFILLFRWFSDFFSEIGNPKLIFGLSWLWVYIISVLIFSSIIRKIFKIN